jgi:hypothetical protein
MARIVFGGGVSHTPVLVIKLEDWPMRGNADKQNKALNLSDGRFVDYETLRSEVGDKYESVVTPEIFQQISTDCHAALDRFASDLAAADPDVIVGVGDDHLDLFGMDNMPSVSVFYGDKIVMKAEEGLDTQPRWVQDMRTAYAQDKAHVFPGHRDLALDIIKGLCDGGVDVAVSSHVPESGNVGLGHAHGYIATRLMGKQIPMVPISLNTYYPPNVPSAARCFAVGRAVRQAIEASPLDLKVAVIASGGLSHFVVDESLDRMVLEAFMAKGADALCGLPRGALNSGSSEILNWVLAAGAIDHLTPRWSQYRPVYRTPAGTGVGVAMGARW